MHFIRHLLGLALACSALAYVPAIAAINASQLGASYNAKRSAITFKVYSSRATRIELWLYAAAGASPEVARIPLTRGSGDVWSTVVSRAALKRAGLNGPVYYGYRAWGPNWTWDADWTKGSSLGFVSDVDALGVNTDLKLTHFFAGHRLNFDTPLMLRQCAGSAPQGGP